MKFETKMKTKKALQETLLGAASMGLGALNLYGGCKTANDIMK